MHASEPSPAERLERLLDMALELEGDEQTRFLSSHRVDPELRDELVRLLRASTACPLLDRAPVALANSLLADDNARNIQAAAGQQLGRYRLIRLLGEGGMASVWLAERDNEDFQHHVAVKCLKNGLLTPESRARFLREQTILARLQHPNIARLYDAGISSDGVPFIVMERVEGCSLTRYCKERRMNAAARLRLFQKLCGAVTYAHQNLIVHRDIKPENVLVGSDGEPKLLDFGIAKLTDEANESITRSGFFICTPEYAAPEQLRGEPISTAADIFSLGALLYELLTGVRPRRSAAGSVLEPPSRAAGRPSTTAANPHNTTTSARHPADSSDEATLAHQLRGDLDTVVLKAMQPEAHRRYATATSLSDDIERYLTHQPIHARKDAHTYRLRKFLQRNAFASITAIVAFIGLAVATTVSVQQARRAERQTERAESEARRSAAATDFLASLFEVAESGQPRNAIPTVETLLVDGTRRILEEFDDAPDQKLSLMLRLARLQLNVGNRDASETLLKQALSLSDATLSPSDPDWLYARRGWAALLMKTPGKDAEAATFLSNAIKTHRDAGAEANPALADALGALAFACLNSNRPDDASRAATDAFDLIERLPGSTATQRQRALARLAQILIATGQWSEAETRARENSARALAVYGEQHSDYAMSLALQATLLQEQYKAPVSALQLAERATAIKRAGDGKPDVEFAYILNIYAIALARSNRLPEAEAVYLELAVVGARLQGKEGSYVATSLEGQGWVASKRRDDVQAEAFFRQELALRRKNGNIAKIAASLINQSQVVQRLGRIDDARELLLEADTISSQVFGRDGTLKAQALSQLALLELRAGHLDRCEVLLRKALPDFERILPAEHPRRLEARIVEAALFNARAEYDEARGRLEAIVAHLADSEFLQDDLSARAWKELAIARSNLGMTADARVAFDTALHLLRRDPFPDQQEIDAIALAMNGKH